MTDDPLIDVIRLTVDALDRVGVPYAITDSIASSIHGEPVVSQDVDFAVRMTVAQARSLHGELPQRLYRSVERLFPDIKDTRSIVLENIGLSWVILDGDHNMVNRFYLEDMSIGLMRPPLNVDIER